MIINSQKRDKFSTKSVLSRSQEILLLVLTKLISFFLNVQNFIKSIWKRSKDSFISFPIKRKLSIIIGLIVVVVIFVLSLIFQQTEKRVLTSKIEEICNLSVHYLASDIKDNLLLGEKNPYKLDEVKESVFRIKNQNINGLDYAWVINRHGDLIAHTNWKLTDGNKNFLSDHDKNYLLNLRDPTIEEKETHYEYYYPVLIPRKTAGEQINHFLGVTGIGFSKVVLLSPVREAQKIIYTIALLVTVLSILGIYFLTQRMVLQINALSEGARQIGQGNLNIKIAVNTRDELGQLAKEFNNMTMHLKEKMQMQKFVSQMTRQMIKKNVYSNERTLASEQCEIAVLFSDVRNFSRFSQRHNPEVVVKVINIYLDLQARIIEENYGIVDKFMGDQIMGVFEGANKHINMLNAAVSIQKAIERLNLERQLLNLEILAVGIGINIGHAVLGKIGSKDRMDYTVVGDVVNLASRFCDVAKPGQIITSTTLLSLFKYIYPTVKLGSISIKGRDEPIEICNIDYKKDFVM
jgi:class 3 adenylate cyclase